MTDTLINSSRPTPAGSRTIAPADSPTDGHPIDSHTIDSHTIDSASAEDRRRAALLAGFSYLALFALGIFANFFVREQLVDTADATATFDNVAGSVNLVRWAIVAFIAAFALDVVVAWALHLLFRPAGRALSALTAWFRIVYTVFLGVAVVFLYTVLQLVDGPDYVSALGRPTLEANTMLALDAFNATWLIGLVAFGIHLALLGTMILRSGLAGRVLGVLLLVAGSAYVFDTGVYTLFDGYRDHAGLFTAIVAVPAVVAEAAFTVWLLARAGGRGLEPATAD